MANIHVPAGVGESPTLWEIYTQVSNRADRRNAARFAEQKELEERMRKENANKIAFELLQSGDIYGDKAANPDVQSALRSQIGQELQLESAMSRRSVEAARARSYDAGGRGGRVLTPDELARQRALATKHLTEAQLLPYRQELQVWGKQWDNWSKTKAAAEKRLAELDAGLSGLGALPDDPATIQMRSHRDALAKQIEGLVAPPPPKMPQLPSMELPTGGGLPLPPHAGGGDILSPVPPDAASSPSGDIIPKARPVGKPVGTDTDAEAWARKNPNDPRAAKILQLLGK